MRTIRLNIYLRSNKCALEVPRDVEDEPEDQNEADIEQLGESAPRPVLISILKQIVVRHAWDEFIGV